MDDESFRDSQIVPNNTQIRTIVFVEKRALTEQLSAISEQVSSYAEYIREAFGNGYRLSDANWQKLRSGTFYNPWPHRREIDASKVLMFHAKDDPHVPYEGSGRFAETTGVTLKSLKRGGHISTDYVTRKYWEQIKKFFDSKL